MTNEEFIVEAAKMLNRHGVSAEVCHQPDTLYLGAFSYMNRPQLVEAALEIIKLELGLKGSPQNLLRAIKEMRRQALWIKP